MGTSKTPKLKAWASVKSVRAATRLKRSVSSSSASSRALRKTKARLMRLDARERPRRARDRRWRLRGEANGVRVFVEESCRRSWTFNVIPLVLSVVAFGLHRFQYIPAPLLVVIAILLLVLTDASMGKWRITGRVRADVRVEASPETAFAFLAASDPSVKREWSAWFEHHRVRSFDAHTALVDTVEAAPLSWARILAPMPRISRTIRFWSREGRTYTIIAADADGTEESSQNKLEWRFGVRTRTTEDLTVVRPRRTHGAEITRDGVMTAAVVTRVLDQDSRLWCSRRSSLALAWSCRKLVDELRGLQLACAHLVDDASFLDQRSHFNYSPAQLQRDAKLSGRSRAATHDDDEDSSSGESDDEGTRLFRVCANSPVSSGLSEPFEFNREPSSPLTKYASAFVLKRAGEGAPSKWGAFAEPAATDFKVRGKNYLADRKKMRSESSLCELAGVDALKATDGPLLNLGSRSDSPCRSLVKNDGSLVLIVNFVLPLARHYVSLAAYFIAPPENTLQGDLLKQRRMLSKFCSATDTVRDETMKIIPKIVEGPWVAKHALGSKPALLGRAVTSEYHAGEGWFEMDIDVSSSSAASGVLRIMKSCSKALVCNLAYVLEGKSEEELPERLLGTMAFVHFDLDPDKSPLIRTVSAEAP